MNPLTIFLSLVCLAASATAQLQVQVKMLQNQWVKGEAVQAKVTITNHTGRELLLDNVEKKPWLRFELYGEDGRLIAPVRRGLYRPISIPNGQSLAKTVNLSAQYNLHRTGRIAVVAHVMQPSRPDMAFPSNRAVSELIEGAVVHRRQAGLDGDPDQLREYRVLQLNTGKGVILFAQVFDVKRGLSIRTTRLGRTLNFHKPTGGLDRKGHYHILFQNSPKLYTHVEFNREGQLLSQGQHQRTGAAVPQLISESSGKIVVLGGRKYDPKAEANRQNQIRGITDRPGQ